jgi:hypothetical protein
MEQWPSWPLLVLLPACVLFGPGASGDDDDGDADATGPSSDMGVAGQVTPNPSDNPMANTPNPSTDTTPQPTCAPQGDDCRASRLDQQNLDGCCKGLVCKDADGGARTCQTANADEQALAEQCNAVIPIASLMNGELTFETPLQSSLGALPFDRFIVSFVEAGPGGCLSDVTFKLQQGSHDQCALMLEAGPVLAGDGGLRVSTSAYFDASDCTGIPPGTYDGNLQGSFVFDGVRCENSPFGSLPGGSFGEFWCYAGTFELHLDGTLGDRLASPTFLDEDAGSDGELSFDQSVARLGGRLCSSLPASSCPTL